MATETVAGYEVGRVGDLDFLLGPLRAHLGDITSAYRYSDGFLRRNLVDGLKSLGIRSQHRYKITTSGSPPPGSSQTTVSGVDYTIYYVERTTRWTFTETSPPVIQHADERPIVLAASIIIKRGELQTAALGTVSWKDDEISYRNTDSTKFVSRSLAQDENELELTLPSRARKLAGPRRQSLPGYKNTREG